MLPGVAEEVNHAEAAEPLKIIKEQCARGP